MMKLPKTLENCPLKEAALEIRFIPTVPSEAVFGIIYNALKDIFKKEPIPLPFSEIPNILKEKDPNFIYKPHYRLEKEKNLLVDVGPRVITFINRKDYMGWKELSKIYLKIIKKIEKTKIFQQIERLSLRYINFFEENIFENLNLKIIMIGKNISNEKINIRVDLNEPEKRINKVIQINNTTNLTEDNIRKSGSLLDIDILYFINNENLDFKEIYNNIHNNIHQEEKILFFSLLTDNLLEKLKPIY